MRAMSGGMCVKCPQAEQRSWGLSVLVWGVTGESYPLEKAAEAVSASLKDARGPKILLVG